MNFDNLPRFQKHQFKILDMIPKWEMLYQVGREQVERQILAAHVWYDANPERAPKKDMIRGLHNWMRIAAEYGHFKNPFPKPKALYKEPEPEGDVMSAEDWAKMRKELTK